MSDKPDTWRGARFGEYVEKPQAGLAKPRIRVPAKESARGDLPAELEALVDDLETWKAAKRKADRLVGELREKVMHAMAGRAEATCGPWRLAIKTEHRKARVTKVKAYDVVRLTVTREA